MRVCTLTIILALAGVAHGQSTLISIADRRDHLFDDQRNVLYMTQEQGTIARYDVLSSQFLTPFDVGNELNGFDITADGNYLYVAEVEFGPTQGFVRKVAAADGTTTNLTYDLTTAEQGSWDVMIMASDKAFFTTQRSGSGGRVPIREITLADDVMTQRDDTPGSGFNGWVVKGTRLDRSADRTAAFIVEPVASKGPVFTYDAGLDTFPFSAEVGAFLQNNLAAVERHGGLFAFEFGIGTPLLDSQLEAVEVINGFQGGVLFSPTQDTLYMVDDIMDQLVALRFGTWTELFRMDIGENVGASTAFDSGVMSISGDGRRLFLSTPAGIRMFIVPDRGAEDCDNNAVADLCDIDCAADDPITGLPCTESLSCGTGTDCNGNIVLDSCELDCNDNGTVDECDIARGAPDCNLNGLLDSCEIDAGTVFDCQPNGIPDRCDADCNGNGLADECDISNGTSTDIDGNGIPDECEPPGAGVLIAVPQRRDHVHDGARDTLYITTTSGHIERFNSATLTPLPPLAVGVKLNGIDITTDGSEVVVAEEALGATLGLVRRVDLESYTTTSLFYELTDAELGAWDVAMTALNTAMFTTGRSGSGGRVPVREIDLEEDIINVRNDAPGSGFDGGVVKQTRIDRSADRNLLFFVEPVASKGPIFTYDSLTATFPHAAEVGSFLQQNLAAVSRDGGRIAFEFGSSVSILAPELSTIELIPDLLGGVAFSPVADILFAVDHGSNEVVALNMINWNELYRLPIGEEVGPSEALDGGVTSMSTDGRLLFLSTPQGVRMLRIPGPEAFDCDRNGITDGCDLSCSAIDPATGLACTTDPGCGLAEDCNANDILDVCDIADEASADINGNGVPDECEACKSLADCADRDGDEITDDTCSWHACGLEFAGLCTTRARESTDFGGLFGACAPDDVTDGNDRFHALNCFANQDTAGRAGYPCEAQAPVAYNVDAAAPRRPCVPDGFCDTADALQAIDVFGDDLACACDSGDPAPDVLSQRHDTARVALNASAHCIRPGGVVDIHVVLTTPRGLLRAYQLHMGVSGGSTGHLTLIDMSIDHGPKLFNSRDSWMAFNLDSHQLAHGTAGPGEKTTPGTYLATFTYRASPDATGVFVVDLLHDDTRPTDRTFLFGSTPGATIPLAGTTHTTITVSHTAVPGLPACSTPRTRTRRHEPTVLIDTPASGALDGVGPGQ